MLPADLTEDIKNRLNIIRGQIEGITKMLDKENDPEQILNQIKAVEKGLDKAHYLLLDEVFRKGLALKIVEVMDTCPGNCGNEEKIEFIRQQFPTLELDEVTLKMKEIGEIGERLARFVSEKDKNEENN